MYLFSYIKNDGSKYCEIADDLSQLRMMMNLAHMLLGIRTFQVFKLWKNIDDIDEYLCHRKEII